MPAHLSQNLAVATGEGVELAKAGFNSKVPGVTRQADGDVCRSQAKDAGLGGGKSNA